ncbi:hypothetical protein APT_01396 [Acetobacter pasteurianus NBRC 101655]|nr:hypothetical protein APT_01396 [Acetobacter pasteurianus NBRC 101655]CCT58376.1 hypothetical protein APA386B_257 [Acetobacter pasteurianus 386B]
MLKKYYLFCVDVSAGWVRKTHFAPLTAFSGADAFIIL